MVIPPKKKGHIFDIRTIFFWSNEFGGDRLVRVAKEFGESVDQQGFLRSLEGARSSMRGTTKLLRVLPVCTHLDFTVIIPYGLWAGVLGRRAYTKLHGYPSDVAIGDDVIGKSNRYLVQYLGAQ